MDTENWEKLVVAKIVGNEIGLERGVYYGSKKRGIGKGA
jgi:hypothetical protein